MYANTYVLSVPEEKKEDYIRIANVFAEVAKDFGALEIFENHGNRDQVLKCEQGVNRINSSSLAKASCTQQYFWPESA